MRFPPELETLATSLRIETRAQASRETLLANLLLALDAEITLLEAELHDAARGAPLLERFAAASSWVQGMRVRVDEEGGYTGEDRWARPQGFPAGAGRRRDTAHRALGRRPARVSQK